METNTILDDATQRAEAVRAQRQTNQAAAVEAARDTIGRHHYEGAKVRLPQIEQAIHARFRPALGRVAAIATTANVSLPDELRRRCAELAHLCDTVPGSIRTGLHGFETLAYRDLVNPAIPAREIVAGTRTLLQSSDGMLSLMDTRLANIEAILTQWPPLSSD